MLNRRDLLGPIGGAGVASVAARAQVPLVPVAPRAAHGRIWAYEVDGYGSRLLMDDANAPSLLSLSCLGAVAPEDPVYRNTRAFALSAENPWYDGKAASGIGGPHIGERNIWPMSIIMHALTSTDRSRSSRRSAPSPRPTPIAVSFTNPSTRMIRKISRARGSPGPTRCSANSCSKCRPSGRRCWTGSDRSTGECP